MKRKFTFLITAAVMLLTMMATTGEMWGQSRTEVTYDFSQIEGFSDWTNSYIQHVVVYDDATVTFSSANRNSQTITDIPVTKGQPVSLVLNETTNKITSVTFVCRQWGSKAQTITLHYSMNGGTSYTSTGITSTNFTISSSSLPEGTNAVEITFSSTSNQIGIESCTINFEAGATLQDSDLVLTDAPVELSFDLYNNNADQVIHYTTSSTGAITVSDSDYIETDVNEDEKIITVTPVAVTNGVKTITVSQDPDDNYKAGSVTFTVNITDSTPFTGGDVTFNAAVDMGTSPLVKNGVTFACSNGALNNGSEYRLYKNSVTTFSVESGYSITQIAFTCTSGNPASGFATQTGWTTDGDNGTWTGDAESVSFTASGAQVRATQIVVTVTVPGDEPYIIADNVELTYDATNGNIAYTINNVPDPAGSLTAAIKDGTTPTIANFSFGTITGEAVPFTCDANTEGTARTAEVTLTYTYNTNETVTKDVTITQAAAPVVYTTIPELFAAATSTETDVQVTFDNWVVSGVSTNGKNIFVTDNNGNGFVIYYSTDMSETYSAGNVLSGTAVSCTLKSYNGFAELLNVDAADLTIENGGTVTAATIAMADLAGVNTGALLHYDNLTCSIDNSKYYLSDGTTTLQVYNALYAFDALEDGKSYNITGVYQQYNNTKEILPRSADDIEEVISSTPVINANNVNIAYDATSGEIAYTISNPDGTSTLGATTTADWVSNIAVTDDKVTFTTTTNEGTEDRVATFTLTYTSAENKVVTVTQGHFVVDYADLPFEWTGNTSAPTGITNNGVGTYSSSPYLKFDGTGDYIILKINERPGVLSFDIKGNGFSSGSTSTFKVQTSTDGTNYADLATYTELGETSNKVFDNLGAEVRYIKWIYTEKGATSGGNVALGNIVLAKYAAPVPSITAEDVNIAYDATEGSIAYTINNPVAGGNFQAIPQTGGDRFIIGEIGENTIPFTCPVNTESNEQTATIELTYTYNRATVSKVVTITQAAAPATMYVVNFNLDDGTFVPNNDFPQDVVEKEAGTYTLPSATKVGYDFTGWNDGTDTYQAGAEYTVSGDVEFTAQWTESTTGTINFNNTASGTAINAASVTGNDSMGNTWTITTEGTTSFTANSAYYQVGSGNSPATSITFTMTLPQQKIISAFEAKFGGFNGTVGDIALTVGNITVGSGSLNGSTDVTVEATTTTEIGTVLTVTVTNIDKGVKCYYISYTLSDAPVVPVIDATAGSALAYNATAGSIIYEIANYEAGTMTATTTADWINALVVTTPTAEDGEVTFNVTENTSNESRSATVTLTFTYGDPATTVTKDVTVTQNGQPSITVTPATANVAFAGGTPEFAVTYESIEITEADDFDVEFYETSTSTTPITKPEWITSAVISGNTTDGFTMTVTVAANDGAAREAYLKVYALDENTEPVYSGLVTISQAAHTQMATYSLVTSVNQIVSGKHYLIASGSDNGTAYAMGNQNENNRSGVAVTIDNSQITETEGVYEFVINTHLNNNDEVEYYTIYDAVTPGYLYAASSSKNYLKTSTTLDDNGKWTIAINNNSATITAQGSNSRKLMRYNPNNNSPIFACYAEGSTTGNAPCLYVKDNDNNLEYYGGGVVAYTEPNIPDGGSITVGDGTVMTVPNNFENTDPTALVIEDGGQLIHESDVQATLQKEVAAYTAKDGDGWYLIATPVEPLATSVVAQGTYDLFTYDEEHAYWYSNTGTGAPFTELHRGQGYLYANASDVDLNYAGTMKATNYNMTVDLSYTSSLSTDVRGFNLVGNPFTRNLVLGDMKIGTNPLTTFYVINTDRTGLQAITSDAYQIKPGEGFFVQATAASQQLSFNPSSKDEIDFRYIKIVAGNEAGYDNAYIQFGNCNTLRKMNIANKTEVYVMDGDDDYAAARVEELAGTMPIHFEAVADGEYTITIEAKYTDAHYMHLLDNLTGDDIDLLVEPSYTFNATTNDNADRFRLVFDCNNYAGVEENYTSEIFAYQNGSDIYVNGNGELQVFDVMGRMVATQHINGVQTINVKLQGVYIFRLNDNTQKIVVR